MEVAHFFHAWLHGDQWPEIVREHIAALREAKFDGKMIFCLLGPEIRAATDLIYEAFLPEPEEPILGSVDVVPVGGFWEQGTIHLLHDHAKRNPGGAIMYAHTKGAADPTPFNARWRRVMTQQLVWDWRTCADLLDRYDAVGPFWLHPLDYPQFADDMENPFFGGNFWMATCSYLARLPRCSNMDRHKAERWIGLGNPRTFNLLEGWPSEASFDRGERNASRLISR